MLTVLRGLALLRYPELVKDLGERRFHLAQVESIRLKSPTSQIASNIQLNGFKPESLVLASGVSICSGTILSFGDNQNGYGRIEIGERTWIGQYNNLRAGGGTIRIGAGCLISQFCTLVARNHGLDRCLPIQKQPPPTDRCGVVLEDDVWLGAGVTITPGLTIHTGAVIAAGSVVTKNVNNYEIWAGIPAQKIGNRR